jgi:chromate transporter
MIKLMRRGVVKGTGFSTIKAFVDGITAEVIGALVGALIIIGIRSIIDLPTALIAIVTVMALIFLNKIREPYIILISSLIGLTLKLLF